VGYCSTGRTGQFPPRGGAQLFSNASAQEMTRRRSIWSCAGIQRPSFAASLRMSPYSGQTPRMAVLASRPCYDTDSHPTVSGHAVLTSVASCLTRSRSLAQNRTTFPAGGDVLGESQESSL